MAALAQHYKLIDLPIHDLPGIRLISWMPDGEGMILGTVGGKLLVRLRDGTEHKWDIPNCETKSSAYDRVRSAEMLPNGRIIASIGTRLSCFDFNSAKPVWQHRPRDWFGFMPTSPHAAVVTAQDEIFVSMDSGLLELRSMDGSLLRRRRDAHAPRFAEAVSGGDLVVGADGRTLSIWHSRSLRPVRSLQLPQHIYGMTVCPDNPWAVVRTDFALNIYDVETMEQMGGIKIAPGLPTLSINPREDLIVFGEGRGAAVTDLKGNRVDQFEFEDRRVLSVKFRPDGERIALGLDDGTVQIV
jgi:WD40 repeat protein